MSSRSTSTAALGSRDQVPAGIFSWSFVGDYLTTMRPYLFFVSGITGILGLALAPAVALGPAALLVAAFFFSYGFGQALTDCFQTDTDAISAPYRPLVRGTVRRRDVMTVSVLGLAAVGWILIRYSSANALLVILSVLGLATYTWFKRRWWAGPFYNAWIVAVLMLMGFNAAAGVANHVAGWPAGMPAALATTFFAYANFVLTGYFKDIAADRATGYRTLPVVFGRRISTLVSDVFAAAAIAAAMTAMARGGVLADAISNPLVLLLLAGGAGTSVLAQVRLHRVVRDSQAHGPISLVVHSYILLLGGVAAAFKPGWALPLLLFHASFVLTLRLRPMREQI